MIFVTGWAFCIQQNAKSISPVRTVVLSERLSLYDKSMSLKRSIGRCIRKATTGLR